MENAQQPRAAGRGPRRALADISNTAQAAHRPAASSLKPQHLAHAAPDDGEVNGWTATDYSSRLELWSSLSAVQTRSAAQAPQKQQLRHSVLEYCKYAAEIEEEELFVETTRQADEGRPREGVCEFEVYEDDDDGDDGDDGDDERGDAQRRVQLSLRVPQVGLFACPDNAADIFINLARQEGATACASGFIEKVQGRFSAEARVTPAMRAILVNWLDNVCLKCKLHEDTLFHAVNYIDRYMSKRAITRNDLQLLGLAALLVASKVAEVDDLVPRVWELRDLCDNAYSANQIVVAERAMLTVLDYHILVPHARTLVELLHCVLSSRTPVVMLSYYLLELGLTSYETTSRYAPSMVAAAAVYLTHVSLHMAVPWPTEVKYVSGYEELQLWDCVLSLHTVWSSASMDPNIAAVYEKYSATEYHEVSSQSLFPVPIVA
eukprot:m51a1_g13000 putative cyclin a (434) ;mRNA; r:199-2327